MTPQLDLCAAKMRMNGSNRNTHFKRNLGDRFAVYQQAHTLTLAVGEVGAGLEGPIIFHLPGWAYCYSHILFPVQ